MNKMTHVEKGIDEINSALSIIGAGRTMHLDDISEICKNTCTLPEQWGHVCQLRVLVSNLGLSVNLQSQWADADRQTESRQTERQTQRGACRYANAAAAFRRQSDIPVRLSMLRGTASRFFSLPQAAFIFHTTGNWTLSSVIEFLGCKAHFSMGN